MSDIPLSEEAEDCRRKALAYVGRPEAPFLLRVAREFDRLAANQAGDGHEAHLKDRLNRVAKHEPPPERPSILRSKQKPQ